MKAEYFARLETLFHAALRRAPDEREAFLRQSCSDDPALLKELLTMLAQDSDPPWALRTEAGKARVPGSGITFDVLPERIGPYRIISRLGEGAMGVVYEAEQENPRRAVALKVTREATHPSESITRQLSREIQVLARLKHPGIVPIYDAGRTEDGRHYFVMELVRGDSLTLHAQRHRLDMRERAELVRQVCDGLHHAHQRGVIHRDLKPANILVDGQGRPRILDFGLARIIENDPEMTLSMSRVGHIQGTLAYMSPEQAAGSLEEIDVRSDVYGLGATLYELLSGATPHDLKDRPLHEALRIISEEDAPPLRRCNPSIHKDLELICAKALARESGRRYQSCFEFMEDLSRYLEGRPVQARPPTLGYLANRWINRHKAAAAVLALLAFWLPFSALLYRYQRDVARRANEGYEALNSIIHGHSDVSEEARRLRAAGDDEGAKSVESLGQALSVSGRSISSDPVNLLVTLPTRDQTGRVEIMGVTVAAARTYEAMRLQVRLESPAFAYLFSLPSEGPPQWHFPVESNPALEKPLERLSEKSFPEDPKADYRFSSNERHRCVVLVTTRQPITNWGPQTVALETWARQAPAPTAAWRFDGQRARLVGLPNLADFSIAPRPPEEWERLCRELAALPSVEHVRAYWFPILPAEMPAIEADYLFRQAGLYNDQRRLDEAAAAIRKAIERLELQLTRDRDRFAEMHNRLSEIVFDQGRVADIRDLLTPLFERKDPLLPLDRPASRQLMQTLAYADLLSGEFDQAVARFQRLLDAAKAQPAPDAAEIGQILNGLGGVHLYMGKIEAALAAYREADQALSRAKGHGHDKALAVRQNVAMRLSELGRGAESIATWIDVLKGRRDIHGNEAWTTHDAVLALAEHCVRGGDVDLAEALMAFVEEARLRIRGPDHPKTREIENNLGVLLAARGRDDEALARIRAAKQSLEKAENGREDELYETLESNLAQILIRKGEPLPEDVNPGDNARGAEPDKAAAKGGGATEVVKAVAVEDGLPFTMGSNWSLKPAERAITFPDKPSAPGSATNASSQSPASMGNATPSERAIAVLQGEASRRVPPTAPAPMPLLPKQGLYVRLVNWPAAARDAGIRTDDLLLRYHDRPLTNAESLNLAITTAKAEGQISVAVELWRDGATQTAFVPPGPLGVDLIAIDAAEMAAKYQMDALVARLERFSAVGRSDLEPMVVEWPLANGSLNKLKIPVKPISVKPAMEEGAPPTESAVACLQVNGALIVHELGKSDLRLLVKDDKATVVMPWLEAAGAAPRAEWLIVTSAHGPDWKSPAWNRAAEMLLADGAQGVLLLGDGLEAASRDLLLAAFYQAWLGRGLAFEQAVQAVLDELESASWEELDSRYGLTASRAEPDEAAGAAQTGATPSERAALLGDLKQLRKDTRFIDVAGRDAKE